MQSFVQCEWPEFLPEVAVKINEDISDLTVVAGSLDVPQEMISVFPWLKDAMYLVILLQNMPFVILETTPV